MRGSRKVLEDSVFLWLSRKKIESAKNWRKRFLREPILGERERERGERVISRTKVSVFFSFCSC